jgi:heme oxygenase (biliverdin-IX-beta and delta-forming)
MVNNDLIGLYSEHSRVAQTNQPELFLAQLREDTRNEHLAVEKALGLVDAGLTLGAYRHRLAQFYGFYKPLEVILFSASADNVWPSDLRVAQRTKTPWLEADLEALGETALHHLPLCANLPDLHSQHARWGCLYVVEGATLGGQIIRRHLLSTLGLKPETGAQFFSGYGAQTAEQWHAFRHLLGVAADSPIAKARIVASAKATFTALQLWCEGDVQPVLHVLSVSL